VRVGSLLATALLGALTGCAGTGADLLTRPYTTEQIRETNTPGTTLVFRISQPEQPPVLQIFEFGDTDGSFVDLGGRVTDLDGQSIGETQVSRPSWEELRDHATYSRQDTTRSDESVKVPAGSFRCTLYTVRKPDGKIDRFWFATNRPGPPVLCTIEEGGAEIFRMELLSATRRPVHQSS
jgi:hypothetical protein